MAIIAKMFKVAIRIFFFCVTAREQPQLSSPLKPEHGHIHIGAHFLLLA